MRLLNVYTFKFAEFEGKNIPPYAIASHRWCEDEASFVDILENKNTETAGYKKTKGFCDFTQWRNEQVAEEQAGRVYRKIEWIWIDTCCIDRRSSAEIAENITSMYKYYERSQECYAYLSDVAPRRNSGRLSDTDLSHFANSSWFTRGWTLQELLAPSRVFFLSSDWTVFGHKTTDPVESSLFDVLQPSAGSTASWRQNVLNHFIALRTGISWGVLTKTLDPRSMRPDEICKWIENRETKKEEDLAYCLLGLFGVFMVPNYGEGENAWSRLEEEVSKKRKLTVTLPRPNQLLPEDRRTPVLVKSIRLIAEPTLKPTGNLPWHANKQDSNTDQMAPEERLGRRQQLQTPRDHRYLRRQQSEEATQKWRVEYYESDLNQTNVKQTDLDQIAKDRSKNYDQRLKGEVADQERLSCDEHRRIDRERRDRERRELEQRNKEIMDSRVYAAEERKRMAANGRELYQNRIQIEDRERRLRELNAQVQGDRYPLDLGPLDQNQFDPRFNHNGRSQRQSVEATDVGDIASLIQQRQSQVADEPYNSRHHNPNRPARDRNPTSMDQLFLPKPAQTSDPELSRPRTAVIEQRPPASRSRSTSRPAIVHQNFGDSTWKGGNSPQKSGQWNTLTGCILS